MTDTPETDAQIFDACDGQGCEAVLAGFSRKLERERNNLQDQRDFCMGEIERLRKERDETRKQLRVAVGLLSTTPQFQDQHPEEVLRFVEEAAK